MSKLHRGHFFTSDYEQCWTKRRHDTITPPPHVKAKGSCVSASSTGHVETRLMHPSTTLIYSMLGPQSTQRQDSKADSYRKSSDAALLFIPRCSISVCVLALLASQHQAGQARLSAAYGSASLCCCPLMHFYSRHTPSSSPSPPPTFAYYPVTYKHSALHRHAESF